jgi:hypothetical protein
MTYSQTPALRLLPDACPPWCDGHVEDYQPWWHSDAGQRERDHATYFDTIGERSDFVTVGAIAVHTLAGIGEVRVMVDTEGAHDAVEQRLTPGQTDALATTLDVDGKMPDVVDQLRAAAAMIRSWLNWQRAAAALGPRWRRTDRMRSQQLEA